MAILTINRGLVTSPNELTKPDGAADILDNCVIDFDNIVQSRRGFGEFGNATDDLSVVKQLMTYKGRIIRHFANKLSFDSTGNGTFLNFAGNYSELVNRLRIKYFELNSNLYFTTNEGIKKISARTADDFTTNAGFITNAGAVKALGLEGVIVPSASGFLPAQSKVAYKVVWAKKDVNGNIIRGVPSSRYVVTNTSKDINVGEEFIVRVTDEGAGVHKQFDATNAVTSSIINITNHGYTAGTKVRFYGSLPKELDKNTDYYVVPANITHTFNETKINSSTEEITIENHNLANNSLVAISGASLPGGLTAGNYYVIRISDNVIKLSTSSGGAAFNLSSTAGTATLVFTPSSLTDNLSVSTTLSGPAVKLTDTEGTGFIYSGINNSHFFTFNTPTNKYAFWFNISGEDFAPTNTLLVGRNLIEVPIYKISTKNKESYIAKIAEAASEILDIEVSAATDKVTITNVDGGNVEDPTTGNIPSTSPEIFLQIPAIFTGQTAVGTPALVRLNFVVPSEIISTADTSYFYEIYRTAPITVTEGLTLNDIDPGEEYQKVEESPVAINGTIQTNITFDDLAAEAFRLGGIFLYTNPVTGEGALQSNENPPIAKDVAVFKGSAFYANTKERHRTQINLLSVFQFISGTSKLYIGNSQTLRTYTFVGLNEIVEFTAKKKSETVNGSYFDISSAQNRIKYRVWFDKGNITHSISETNINVSTGVISITDHGLANNDKIVVSNSTPVRGLLDGTYYVINRTADTFKLSTSINGSAFTFSSTGDGTATLTCSAVEPASDSILTLKASLSTYDDTVEGSVTAFEEAFFDVLDFNVNGNIKFKFDATEDVDDSNDAIEIKNHGFLNGDKVKFVDTAPTGLVINTEYFVVNKTTNSFKVSLTSGGSAINIGPASGISEVIFIPAASKIRISYADNGEANDVTQSSPASSWTFSTRQQGTGENASTNTVLLSGLSSQGLSVEDTARSLERVINKDINSPVTAYYASSPDDLPGILIFESKSLLDDNFYLGFSHETDTAVFNPALPVAKTITGISSAGLFTTSTTHQFTPNQQVYTFVQKNSTIIVSGSKTIATTPATTTYTLSEFSAGTAYTTPFAQAIIFSAEVASDNSINQNRLYYSKINQPEAVPLVNFIDIGPRDKAIQRIMALRDSLIVLKEDGVYVISGPSAPNFSVRLSDSSALTFAPDTATNLNNLIYVLTSQGIVTVSETGVGVISRNIENKIQEVTSSRFDYKLMSWGMASESDRCYLIWLPEKTTDGYATQAFRYNTFTRTWTRWTKPANCGIVNPADDKIYLGDASSRPYVLKERKNFERQDYADREIVRSLGANAISGLKFTISSVAELEPGDSIVQYQYLDINKFNRILKKLDRDTLNSNNYYSSLKAVTGDSLSNKLIELESKLALDGIIVPAVVSSDDPTDIRDSFNAIVDYLNLPGVPTGFKNYKRAEDILVYETLVTEVDQRTNIVTVKLSNKFVQGDVSFFKAIKCLVQYSPQHFGKPEATKQVSDGTFIFDQNNFWGGTVAYASDRSYDFASITFPGKGPGYWDGYSWANVTFGGEGNEVPVRTLVPRDKSRCRYLHVQFSHSNAREGWKLIGVSLEPREVSTRGYR